MDLIHILLLLLIGMGGAFVQRVSGFGLGIFVMMFLPYIMPTHTMAATVASIFSCVTSTYNAIRYRKSVRYRLALPMFLACMISSTIAVRFSTVVSGEIFRILLGAALILLSLYFIFFHQRVKMKPSVKNGVVAGSLGGILGGLFSTGGPPVVLYLSNAIADNVSYFATIQFYFSSSNIYTTAVRAFSGLVTYEVILYSGIGILGCLIGDRLGRKVFDRLDPIKLKKIIYICMMVSGIVMFF